jgi:hypothetical protein
MASLLQVQVIVVATTGNVSRTLTTYAERVSEITPFQVVIVDGKMLKEYQIGGAMYLRRKFQENAKSVMLQKRPQVIDSLEGLGEDES